MKIAMKLKPVTSTRIVSPIGTPSRSWVGDRGAVRRLQQGPAARRQRRSRSGA